MRGARGNSRPYRDRREFIVLFAAAVGSRPVIALAQVSTKRPLIAVLVSDSQAVSKRWRSGLPQGLQELGFVEGRDYEIEYRYADGDLTRLPALVDELIRHKPNVLVVGTTSAAVAAKKATASIPIIVAATSDPPAWQRAKLAHSRLCERRSRGHGRTGGPPSARAIPRSLTRPAASPISPHPQSPQGAVRWRRVAVRAEARRLPGLGRHLRWPDVAELCGHDDAL